MQKDFLGHGREDISKTLFLFPITLIGEMVFSTDIYKLFTCPTRKALSGLIQVPNQLLFQGEIFHFL